MSTIKANLIEPNTTSTLSIRNWDGWIDCNETWTYASTDTPTFTLTVVGDVTTKYSVGMKAKLTQSSTIKYFIITAISYSSPNTTITLYGGNDYTLTSAGITLNYVSHMKAPYGFPMSPSKWTVEVTDVTLRAKTNPTNGTWYYADMGSINISIPIGTWKVSYQASLQAYKTTAATSFAATLSTENNSESDNDLTVYAYSYAVASFTANRQKIIALAAKTSYYMLMSSQLASVEYIHFQNDSSKLIIRAECAYL